MPFDADDRLDRDALARNIGRWLETPLSGFVLGTANGEELFLSEDEKTAAIKAVAGIDSPSVTDTLRVAERAAAAGADMVRYARGTHNTLGRAQSRRGDIDE